VHPLQTPQISSQNTTEKGFSCCINTTFARFCLHYLLPTLAMETLVQLRHLPSAPRATTAKATTHKREQPGETAAQEEKYPKDGVRERQRKS